MKTILILVLSLILFQNCTEQNITADVIYRNGYFYTVNEKQPVASEIALKNDKFIFVGQKTPHKFFDEGTLVIDLKGKFVLPGFIDSHLHFMDGGFSISSIDLRNAASKDEFIKKIENYAKNLPKGDWILSGNWDHTLWKGQPLPERWWIDKVTPDNPVMINRLDGHMALANSLALKLAGLTNDVKTPPGGVIVRNKKEEITGILKESAMQLVRKVIPNASIENTFRAAKSAMNYLLQNGITTVHDMGTWEHVEVYDSLISANELKVRISSFTPIAQWEKLKNYRLKNTDSNFLKIKGTKGFMDGSLGSSTAKFFKPYLAEKENFGIWDDQMIPPEKMLNRIKNVATLNYQVVTHAIGTEANNLLLDMYEEALNNNNSKRFRIEHAQHLLPEDIDRFAELGVLAAMQPYHCIDDGRWAETRIEYERCKTTYAFRDLIDKNVIVAFGSDWDVAPASPLWGIYAAVTRRTLDKKNEKGWIPEQKISVEEAIKCYTINGAYADFSENEKGSIETGKLADFVVLSENLFEIDPAEIKNVEVNMTVVGGEIVYER
ncbi:MAG: amidohydrolase [Calditrichia bacterium]|nr:amidohydrolase [Calditrichia bacterium]